MSKKTEAAEATEVAAAPAAEKPAGGTSDKDSAPYRIGKWRGRHTNYSCNACPFATLSKAEIEAHVKIHRTPTRKRAR